MTKIVKIAVMGAVLGFGLSLSALAQQQQTPNLMPGMVDMLPSMNTMMTNSINTSRIIALGRGGGVGGASGKRVAVRKPAEVVRGEAVIRAGKATTAFVPTEAGMQAFLKVIDWDKDMSQPAKQTEYVQRLLVGYKDLLRQGGFKENDNADALVMGLEISNIIKYGSLSAKSDVAAMRQDRHQDFLQNSYYQGMTDTQKQVEYLKGMFAGMQAFLFNEAAKTANTEEQRDALKQRARDNAEVLISSFFN